MMSDACVLTSFNDCIFRGWKDLRSSRLLLVAIVISEANIFSGLVLYILLVHPSIASIEIWFMNWKLSSNIQILHPRKVLNFGIRYDVDPILLLPTLLVFYQYIRYHLNDM